MTKATLSETTAETKTTQIYIDYEEKIQNVTVI